MDWVSFFKSNNIHHVTSGPNTSKGQIGIQCPWCGQSDEGQHLSINLEGKGFRCWRQPTHSGKNPARLIQALLNCSWEQATALAGNARTLPNDFLSKVKGSMVKQEAAVLINKLKLPEEFKRFSRLPSCKMYLNYINSRGFSIKDTEEYEIYYATQGLYKGRIMFTVTMDKKLVGYTGRTIFPTVPVRYKTLTNDPEKAEENGEIPAPAPISDFLLFYDRLVETDADTIVLCEGPFDAWKVSILGSYIGVVATCFFTSSLSKGQANLLHELLPKFKNRHLLLDQNTFTKAAKIKADLTTLDVTVKQLPKNIDDPGDIKTLKQLKDMLAIV